MTYNSDTKGNTRTVTIVDPLIEKADVRLALSPLYENIKALCLSTKIMGITNKSENLKLLERRIIQSVTYYKRACRSLVQNG